MKVQISEIKSFSELLLNHILELAGDEVEVDFEYYWHISAKEKYDMNILPVDHTIGQLSQDIENLRKAHAENSPLAYDLVWLSAILRALGEKVIG